GRQRDRDAGGDSAWWRFVQHPGVVAEERLTRHWLDTRQVEGLPCRIGMRCGKQYSGDKVVDVDRAEDALAAGGQDQAALLDLLDRDDRPRPRSRTIDVARAHDRDCNLAASVRSKGGGFRGDLGVDV